MRNIIWIAVAACCIYVVFFVLSNKNISENINDMIGKKQEKYSFVESRILKDSVMAKARNSSGDSDSKRAEDSKNTESTMFKVSVQTEDSNKLQKSSQNNKVLFDITASDETKDFTHKQKIIGIFGKDCTICSGILPHINALAGRHRNVDFIILNQRDMLYNSSAFGSDIFFKNLVETQGNFVFFIDSIKRKLNIEIRDFASPLFLIINDNEIKLVIEGVAIEEMLEGALTL